MSLLYSSIINPEFMDSNICLQEQRYNQNNSGFLRYLSVDISNGGGNSEAMRGQDNNRYVQSTGQEADTMSAKFLSSNNDWSGSESLDEFGEKSVKEEETEDSVPPQKNGYSYDSRTVYQTQQIQVLPDNYNKTSEAAFDGSFSAINSMVLEPKMGPNLIRQNSSPPGIFCTSSIESGFAAQSGRGSLGVCSAKIGEARSPANGLDADINFQSRPSSCSRPMPQVGESGDKGIRTSNPEERLLGNANLSNGNYLSKFPRDSWEFNNLKTSKENYGNLFSTSSSFGIQNLDFGHRNHGLTHHWSLTSSSTKMSATDKYLQLQGSVPCKIRAKRGFATHPRSIAERNRRTRISERIKKLQDLFPNMDKHTNTADMLELAVQSIKDLQKQVKTLSDTKAKCTCPNTQKQRSSPCA